MLKSLESRFWKDSLNSEWKTVYDQNSPFDFECFEQLANNARIMTLKSAEQQIDHIPQMLHNNI